MGLDDWIIMYVASRPGGLRGSRTDNCSQNLIFMWSRPPLYNLPSYVDARIGILKEHLIVSMDVKADHLYWENTSRSSIDTIKCSFKIPESTETVCPAPTTNETEMRTILSFVVVSKNASHPAGGVEDRKIFDEGNQAPSCLEYPSPAQPDSLTPTLVNINPDVKQLTDGLYWFLLS